MRSPKYSHKGEAIVIGLALSLTLPVFRSGGRTGLTFWEFVVGHTIWGPPVEYVPLEDYLTETQKML